MFIILGITKPQQSAYSAIRNKVAFAAFNGSNFISLELVDEEIS